MPPINVVSQDLLVAVHFKNTRREDSTTRISVADLLNENNTAPGVAAVAAPIAKANIHHIGESTRTTTATKRSADSSCSDDTPCDTKSMSDEENLHMEEEEVEVEEDANNCRSKNLSKDMTESTEPSSLASASPSTPDDTASEATVTTTTKELDDASNNNDNNLHLDTAAAAESSGVDATGGDDATATGGTATGSPPKFYRLNAFMKEPEDEESEDDNDVNDVEPEPIMPPDVEADLRTSLGYDEAPLSTETADPNNHFATTSSSSSALPNDTTTAAPTTTTTNNKRCGVRFKSVCIREYDITIGDNPYCSYGVPICLDWQHGEEEVIPIDFYEASKKKRKRTARRMLLNSFQRRDMLWRSGYPLEDIEKAIKANDREKFRRSLTLYFLPLYLAEEMIYFGAEKLFHKNNNSNDNNNNDNDNDSIKEEALRLTEIVERQQQRYRQQHSDTESGGISEVEYEKPRRRLSFKAQPAASSSSSRRDANNKGGGEGGSITQDGITYDADVSMRSGSVSERSAPLDRDDPYAASNNSFYKAYAVRVDRGQHDKATEIIICNFQRPHMRAFHASWFSFFVAFFTWFAVTPLLGEIMETLHLTKADIWTSSLYGTAGSIIMRIFMGPTCDKFGARICMAFILAAAAIPCALIGLVETSQGLSAVRSFVGIAGSSFVACQYWTSQMFTREVAGTANALVAGWGNLGGGVAQIVMGSALFPLFKMLFKSEDKDDPNDGDNSSELAWRTVFVVPAVVCLVVSFTIVFFCDDSPKGAYRERVRQQEIMVVSPMASLCAAGQNWNVWILLIQYACCFGVEVTMTNATALYFRDEFGQTTVSAAAIASVFGFMNLFARGAGGFISDMFNAKYSTRGRLAWQSITLFLEGVGIIIFGFAESLGGSIVALIFLSLMVQSAEGSTFGIVPYVDRRFTGAVVGWVGAGGNVGGACFSILFIQFDYKKAFALMGIMASCSAFLSCFINREKLTRNAETLGVDGKKEEEIVALHNEGIGITKNTAITFAQLEGLLVHERKKESTLGDDEA